jgi:hypothetical protein
LVGEREIKYEEEEEEEEEEEKAAFEPKTVFKRR